MGKPPFDYRSLSVAERLELVGDIWDSIAEETESSPDSLPLSAEQKAELDRRLADLEDDSSPSIPMDEALASIRAQFRKPR